LAAAMNA
jgi:Ca2+-binding EF-hand superfamily protein